MLSPLGGFMLQSRAGAGNFEVVIPWPAGGLAVFSRDNDGGTMKWFGPTQFGSGEYTGATVIESDFRAFDADRGNLEVAAVRPDGVCDFYARENGGAFRWSGPFTLPFGSPKAGNPSMAYSGATKETGLGHGTSMFFLVVPERSKGFSYWVRRNLPADVMEWVNVGGTGQENLVGIGIAITTWGAPTTGTGYKYLGAIGNYVVAGVTAAGQLELHVNGPSDSAGIGSGWVDRTTFGRDLFPDLAHRFTGRPCIVQGDIGYEEDGELPFDNGHYGNLELMVPDKSGGILHFWRDCGEPGEGKRISEGWGGPVKIAGPLYDEVSLIQSTFNGNFELVARRRHQRGFDFWWRDEGGTWHGPDRIGPAPAELRWRQGTPSFGQEKVAPGTSPTSWYTAVEKVQHIAYVGADRKIHECFYFIGGENRWLHSVPGEGQPLVAPGTSPTSWFATPDNVQHIAYVTEGRTIHQLFYFIHGFGGWQGEPASSGQPLAAQGTSPTSWYTTSENVQHIAYAGEDGRVHECYFFVHVGVPHVWRHNLPSGEHLPAAPGVSPTSWYTPADNVQHVAYVGNDGQIQECFYFIA